MSKHFRTYAGIAVFESAPRGVTVRPCASNPKMVQLLLHNGCGRGNMITGLTNEMAIEVAIELIRAARNPR